MAGLVSYESSDEEDTQEEVQHPQTVSKTTSASKGAAFPAEKPTQTSQAESADPITEEIKPELQIKSSQEIPAAPSNGPEIGPSIGPSLPPMDEDTLLEDAFLDDDPGYPPGSPYSRERAIIRDLTLPAVPCLHIPPSPPGSPPPEINKKVASFLELKKKGNHFNTRLAQSSALSNPSLMDKLMAFVGIDDDAQYETTISKDIWDPSAFPEWAYKEPLREAQQKVLKKIEEDKKKGPREAISFVTASSSSPRSTTARNQK